MQFLSVRNFKKTTPTLKVTIGWVSFETSLHKITNSYNFFRGGVLEAEAIVEIKYKKSGIIQTMHRLDPTLKELKARLDSGAQQVESDKQPSMSVEKQISEREMALLPIYHQIACRFADLHDTPVRMLEKDAISVSNNFFYFLAHF